MSDSEMSPASKASVVHRLVMRNRTGVGKYCTVGPPEQQKQMFMVTFEDTDRGIALFDDEQEARDFFAKAEGGGWNCHLWQLAERDA